MPVTQAQFRSRLTESGIMTAEELAQFAEGGAASVAEDPASLAQALLAAERITPFQAEILLADAGTPLRLGRYLLLDRVGSGGMGQVHKAIHDRMNRIVALKLLPPSAALDPGLVARFRREVQVAAKLKHPHIVTAYDADEADGVHFLVMELVEGRDLGVVVAEDGPLPVERALDCIRQTAEALAYAHDQGVLHRDIKPANLLLDEQGHVRVLDMGLARLDSSEGLTTTGDVIGTATTMAPEQGDDTRLVDERSDVYSLGCTLYFLLTGKHVYESESALQMLLAHARDPIPKLRDACPEASPELEALFTSMVQKRREDRPPDMAAVLAGLAAVRAGFAPEVPLVLEPRRRRPHWGLTAVALLLAGVGVWLLFGRGGSTPREAPGDAPPAEVAEATAPVLRVLRGHTGAVHGLKPHPDGERLLSASGDNTVGIWDIASGEMLGRLAGHTESVRGVLCLSDGNTVISASDDKTIRIWDLAQRKTVRVLTGNQAKVRKVALAVDESWFASAGKDGTLRIWDLPAGTERLVRREHGPWLGSSVGLMGVTIRPDGQALATVAFDRTVRIFDTQSFTLEKTLGPFEESMGAVAYAGRGDLLLHDYGAGPVRALAADGSHLVHTLVGHEDFVYSIACARTRPIAATGSQDQSVSLWNLETGEELAVLRGHEFTVGSVAFSLDEKVLFSGAGDETIRLWDVSAYTQPKD